MMFDNLFIGVFDLVILILLEGLVDEIYNIIFYYENDSFDVCILYNYKDKYVEYIECDMYFVYCDVYG